MSLNHKSRNKTHQSSFPLIKPSNSIKIDQDMKKTLLKGKLYSLINKSNIMSDEELANTLEKFNGSNNYYLTEENDEIPKISKIKNKKKFYIKNSFIYSNKFEDDRVKIEELLQKNFNNQERKTIFAYPEFFGINRNPIFKEFAKVQSKNLKDVLDKEEILFKNKDLDEKDLKSRKKRKSENSDEVFWFNYFYFNDIFHNKNKNKTKSFNTFSNRFIKEKSNKTLSISKKNMSCNRVNINKFSPIKLKDFNSKKKLISGYEDLINDFSSKDIKKSKEDPVTKMKGYNIRRKIMQDKRKRLINKMKEKYKLKYIKNMETAERDFTERKYVDNIISILKKNYSHIKH